ncbi:MAG: phage shock protein B [Flavobacteriales bacterium]|jgi:phage shock protein B
MHGDITGLVAVVMIFSIPLFAILSGVLKARYKAQQSSFSGDEREQLERLSDIADRMSQRIETLEEILDAEVPDWREDHG